MFKHKVTRSSRHDTGLGVYMSTGHKQNRVMQSSTYNMATTCAPYFSNVSFFEKDTCSRCLFFKKYRQNDQNVFLRKRPVGLYRNMAQTVFLKKRRFEPVFADSKQTNRSFFGFEMH